MDTPTHRTNRDLVEAGRDTDILVAQRVFGWRVARSRQEVDDASSGLGPPVLSMDVDGSLWLVRATTATNRWRPSRSNPTAVHWLWPKIVERLGPGVAIIWDRNEANDTVGDDDTPEFRIVQGGNYWSAFEIDTHTGLDVSAPTLALCLTRVALALYPGGVT